MQARALQLGSENVCNVTGYMYVSHTRMQVIIVAWQDAKTHFILSPFACPLRLVPICSLFLKALIHSSSTAMLKKGGQSQRSRSPTDQIQSCGPHVKQRGGGCRTSDFAYVVDRLVG